MNAEALIGTVLGTCTLQRLIGQGGMGAVYLAQQSRPRRQVAVKVLLPAAKLKPHQLAAFLERFRRETDAAASLEHPNIMPVHEYGEHDGLAYLVMPYISGGTLRDAMEREGPMSPQQAAFYLDQIAAALDFAHAHGVIHRDIKPANILLTPEGRALLTDFGLVKVIAGGQPAHTRLTGEGAPVGTPDYMSPEQVMGDEVDGRADLYSLGVILYQMITGTTPFQGETPMQIAAQQLHTQPASPRLLRPDLPVAVEQVMLRMMAKRPADRFQTGREFALAFRAAAIPGESLSSITTSSASIPAVPAHHRSPGLLSRRSGGLLDPQWQSGLLPAVAQGQDRGYVTGILPATNTALPARSSGLLSRTGMFPRVGTTGAAVAAPANNQVPATPPGERSLLGGDSAGAYAPSQRLQDPYGPPTLPQVDFNGIPIPFDQVAGSTNLTPGTAVFPTASDKQAAILPSAFAQMSPDFKTTSGSLAVPDYEQINSSTTVKLTGPLKIVQVPVAGQPGQYMTGLLSVPAQAQPLAPAKGPSKKVRVIGLLVALVMLLAGSTLGLAFVRSHFLQQPSSLNSSYPTTSGTPNLQATAIAQATATAQANIILSDTLDQNYHNWPISNSGTKLYQFKSGAYHITNLSDQGVAVVLQAGAYSQPIGYQLTMQEIKGDDTSINNSFGMIIRYSQQTKGNQVINTFYSFEVLNTNNGEYRFYKYDNSKGPSVNPWTLLWHQPFGKEFHQGHTSKSINTVKIFANGSAFTFTVNGKVVGTAKDSSFKAGTVGMLVNLKGTEVAFSDLLITRN
ncbi:MAG TPA: serine/threonine-protein kinase [Ktedonobacteraceae bacterium]|jgi:serine/threonine protein kinase|nr:serine/threonine-protein kinase [Ktedonobacteraceae bacterium]